MPGKSVGSGERLTDTDVLALMLDTLDSDAAPV